MSRFDLLVREQLQTMDKLLFIQSELERCQELERELKDLQNKTEMQSLKEEIQKMKAELKEIQHTFERQTEEVITAYKHQETSLTTAL
ncbi:YgaB family protein [Bacillus pinisoli]|uniref:YgaB family protein n=1 Tax=Bacillus pinisoli TaxID=2901866 RepID=UPI001FF4DD85|nr:YgaB family protein [Bacillus pinisoli]